MYGTHCIKTWSSTQAIIALSSGEAEYLGVVKATSIGLGLKSMLADMSLDCTVHVLSDATAAIGIANRRGLGQVRHMAVHYLWVQERVKNGDITLSKVWGKQNPADLLTKHLDFNTIQQYMSLFGLQFRAGRSHEAPTLASIALRFPGRSRVTTVLHTSKGNKQI